MILHKFWSFFWNASIERKHYWLFWLFWNRTCISFDKDDPILVKDLWLNHIDKHIKKEK